MCFCGLSSCHVTVLDFTQHRPNFASFFFPNQLVDTLDNHVFQLFSQIYTTKNIKMFAYSYIRINMHLYKIRSTTIFEKEQITTLKLASNMNSMARQNSNQLITITLNS